MGIMLSILQGILWLLAGIVCILLVSTLAVLFVPVRYELEGDFHEQSFAKANIRWLLRLFDIRLLYEENLIFVEIKFFWKTKTFSFDFTKEVEEEAQKTKKAVEKEIETVGIIEKIKGILNHIQAVYPRFKKIVKDEKNKAAVRHIRKELLLLLKIILPHESKADILFSTGAPDITGQVYGAVCCLPIIYQENWQLLPDFAAEEAYFSGNFMGKGKIYGYQVIGIIFRIIFDKNCQRLYTIMRRFIKFWKRTPSQEEK